MPKKFNGYGFWFFARSFGKYIFDVKKFKWEFNKWKKKIDKKIEDNESLRQSNGND